MLNRYIVIGYLFKKYPIFIQMYMFKKALRMQLCAATADRDHCNLIKLS